MVINYAVKLIDKSYLLASKFQKHFINCRSQCLKQDLEQIIEQNVCRVDEEMHMTDKLHVIQEENGRYNRHSTFVLPKCK